MDEKRPSLATSVSVELGILLALVGGFQDAYSFVGLGGVFANAQTGNVVLLGAEAARGDWADAARHVLPILAFVIGVVVAATLERPRVAAVIRWPACAAIVLEILVLMAAGFMPPAVPAIVVVVIIAFSASVQSTTFRTLITWPYNTAMVTGNLRTAAQAAYGAIVDRDPEAGRKARSFAIVILSFLAGAFAGGWMTLRLGQHAIWVAAGVLTVALGLFVVGERSGERRWRASRLRPRRR
jgi:uncharacterized membrane protein YoaK (UPF0700 family)